MNLKEILSQSLSSYNIEVYETYIGVNKYDNHKIVGLIINKHIQYPLFRIMDDENILSFDSNGFPHTKESAIIETIKTIESFKTIFQNELSQGIS